MSEPGSELLSYIASTFLSLIFESSQPKQVTVARVLLILMNTVILDYLLPQRTFLGEKR